MKENSLDVQDEFARQCEFIVTDLERVQGIIDRAVAELAANFAAIAEFAAVAPRSAGEPETGRAADIARHAQAAIVHLQFHDLTVQMLGNLSRRVAALAGRETNIGHLREEGIRDAVALHRHCPAPGGKEGDIELF